jgi:hypothetical protein
VCGPAPNPRASDRARGLREAWTLPPVETGHTTPNLPPHWSRAVNPNPDDDEPDDDEPVMPTIVQAHSDLLGDNPQATTTPKDSDQDHGRDADELPTIDDMLDEIEARAAREPQPARPAQSQVADKLAAVLGPEESAGLAKDLASLRTMGRVRNRPPRGWTATMRRARRARRQLRGRTWAAVDEIADVAAPILLEGDDPWWPQPRDPADGTADEDEIDAHHLSQRPMYWDLDGRPIGTEDRQEWAAKLLAQESARADGRARVASETFWRAGTSIWVSTMWIGVDVNMYGPPQLWETMVFVAPDRLRRVRLSFGDEGGRWSYASKAAALAGHRHVASVIRAEQARRRQAWRSRPRRRATGGGPTRAAYGRRRGHGRA